MESELNESGDEYDGTYAHQKADSESENESMIEVSLSILIFLVASCKRIVDKESKHWDSHW